MTEEFNYVQIRGTPEDRATLVLYFEYGYTMAEIGYIFGLSEAAVSIRLSRLKDELRVL